MDLGFILASGKGVNIMEKSQLVFVKVLFMCDIPFLKDALNLRPETEAVEKLLEGLPREIIRLESL